MSVEPRKCTLPKTGKTTDLRPNGKHGRGNSTTLLALRAVAGIQALRSKPLTSHDHMADYTPAERAAAAVSTRVYQAERDVPRVPLKPGELAAMIEAEYAPIISGLEAMNRHTLHTKNAENKRLLEALRDIERLLDCGNIEQSHWDDCLDVARAALGKPCYCAPPHPGSVRQWCDCEPEGQQVLAQTDGKCDRCGGRRV